MRTESAINMAEVVVRTKAGTYHRAIHNLNTDVVLTPEGCNLDDAESLQTFPDMPEEALAIELCKRCYSTSTDR